MFLSESGCNNKTQPLSLFEFLLSVVFTFCDLRIVLVVYETPLMRERLLPKLWFLFEINIKVKILRYWWIEEKNSSVSRSFKVSDWKDKISCPVLLQIVFHYFYHPFIRSFCFDLCLLRVAITTTRRGGIFKNGGWWGWECFGQKSFSRYIFSKCSFILSYFVTFFPFPSRFPGMIASDSRSRNVGMDFFHSLPVPEFLE